MKLRIDDDTHELLVIDYQMTEIARLNEVLKRNGIASKPLRTSICAEFASANGMFLDRGWLEGEAAGRYWPELAFARRDLHPQDGLASATEIVLPEYASNFHAYASAAIELFFQEGDESHASVRTGCA